MTIKLFQDSKISKLLLVIGLISLVTGVVKSVTNLYLWEETQNAQLVIATYLAMFATIPLAGLVAGVFADKINAKLVLLVSVVLFGFILLAAGLNPEWLIVYVVGFGVIRGFATGLYAIPINSVVSMNVGQNIRDKFYGYWSIVITINGLVIPVIIATVAIWSGVLSILYLLVFPAAIVAVMLLSKSKLRLPDHSSFDIVAMFDIPRRNKDWFAFGSSTMVGAVRESVMIALRDVIALVMLGSIAYWGLFSVGMQLISIAATWLVEKIPNLATSRAMYGVISFIYTASAIFLVVDFTTVNFLIFSAVEMVYVSFEAVCQDSMDLGMMEQDPEFHKSKLETEYAVLREFPLAIGRLAPLLLMAIVMQGIDADETRNAVKLAYLMVGFVPYVMMLIMKKSRAFTQFMPIPDDDELVFTD